MNNPQATETDVEVDVRALLATLWRRLPYLIVFIGIVAVGTYFVLAQIAPVYRSGATVIIETGESGLTRTTQTAPGETATVLDREAIASQVQLIRSRDLAKTVAQQLDLAARPEFNPLQERSWLGKILAALGLSRQTTDSSTEERVLNVYYDRLSVFTVENSRVIAIDFSSEDPALAASAANAIAEEYISLQRAAKRDTTADAAQWLAAQIADLRAKVQDAEAKVERYRAEHDLFSSGGATPATLPQQQLADLNAELTRVRSVRAEAEAKAAQIKNGLKAGSVPNLADVLNSPLIQRLIEQQVALRSEIAQLNATLLPQHPKMRALNAQVADLDRQVAAEANKILQSLESEAQLAAARESEIDRSLVKLKTTAATANDAGVELRALEREAAAQRDLLESYLGRYREALAREQADYLPADARIISRASVPIDPDFPKKVPMTLAATVAALILAIAFVLLRELASGRPMRRVAYAPKPLPAVPGAVPVDGHSRWADDHSVRRMMPKEPTLVPELVDHVEESLAIIAGDIVKSGKKRVLVTLTEGSDSDGRPLGAVALARALARTDARIVLVDLRGDGADAVSMGEGADLPGFTDLFDGEASFAQVIFRDRKSRVHFIPVGRKPLSAALLDKEQLETVLSALTLTYDYVLLDAGDDMIEVVGPSSGVTMVVSEFGAADPRTVKAFDRVTEVSDAKILLLVVDPVPASPPEDSDREKEETRAGAAA
ncbi:MAG: Wzz/FepE/Etk N-terminal domain-containing protein [Bauldia sp.]|nr:Wzz/FepE/Etk N-terminal domain-containing protein [Bauldia sp.]